MTKFLEKVAGFILDSLGNDTLHTVVIFPTKRSEIFLKNHLKNKVRSGYWLPEFYTIDEFMVEASGLAELDPVNVYFELYKIHKKIARNDARSLDDFLAWAPIMLADFTDIDLYLADAKTVFTSLSEARALEHWNLSRQPLTDLQKNYLAFYNSLYQYYTELTQNLKAVGSGYKGMMYRHLCDNMERIAETWTWKRFVLVGFNALSEAEKKVFGHLIKNYKTNVLFDADEYFVNHPKNKKHEAGRFIHELINDWNLHDVDWLEDSIIDTKDADIKVLGVPKRIGQVKYAAQVLEEWITDDFKNKTNPQLTDTAVIFGDEKMLVPFLNSLPEVKNRKGKKVPFNITMGYPVKNGAAGVFVLKWLSLLHTVETERSGLISVSQFIELLNNPFFRIIAGQTEGTKIRELIRKLLRSNASFIKEEDLHRLIDTDNTDLVNIIKVITGKNKGATEFTSQLVDILFIAKKAFENEKAPNSLLKEQLLILMSITKKLDVLLQEVRTELTFRALEKIFTQLLSRHEINLKGEPLSGIQVMGMLETRNLDFENLLILSVNDGILPRTENMESFIPFDIRRNFGLPLPSDKTDVYAYHFFRLLKRARKIHLVYDSEPDALGGGEKSRYLLQLEKEILPGKITETRVTIPIGELPQKQEISIEKTAEVKQLLEKTLKKSLSPTALTTYINCPLQFYFRYVIGIKQPDTLESDIEANIMGKVIHSVLEDLFKAFVKRTIDPDKLNISVKEIRRRIIDKFKEEFPGGNLDAGKNLLIVEVAIEYVRKYLASEIKMLTQHNRTILGTEEQLSKIIQVNNYEVNFNGFVDRADQVNGTNNLRIVDYKTGKVERSDLTIKDWEELISDPNKAKAFQVACYAYLFLKKTPVDFDVIEAGIISMRKISNGFMPLQLPDKMPVLDSMDVFERILFDLIGKITDAKIPFDQTDDEDRCAYCDFKDICNRNPKSKF